jgi:hypothetical protein
VTEFRPELADHHDCPVDSCIEAPSLSGFCPSVVLMWVVGGGDSCRCPRADDLGKIDCVLATIISGHRQTAKRISSPVKEASPAKPVVSVIVVKDNRQEGFDEQLLARLIREIVPIVAALPSGTLTERRVFFAGLANACFCSCEDEGRGSDTIQEAP